MDVEEEKKTTTKKSTPKKEEKVEKAKTTTTKKKTTTKKITKSTPKKEEVKLLEEKTTEGKNELVVVDEVKVEKKKATPKKKTTKKPVKDDIELEKKEEIEVEEVPEVEEETSAVPVVSEEPKQEEVKKEEVLEKVEEVKEEPTDTTQVEETVVEEMGESYFDGKLIQLIGWLLIGLILTVVTLGLGFPFAYCFILDWRFKHTVVNGRRLSFDGNGLQLWGNYLKWLFFTVITLGIFLLFLPVQWNRWIVKHTHYEENKKPVVNYSLFDGITWEYVGISVLTWFLNTFSFGLLNPFCETLMYSWRINHTTYDTIDMEFDGKGFQLLGNYIKWCFLSIITLGIYSLWIPIRRIQWEVKHTHEKGFAKHPYRPVLGMVLPIIFAAGCLSAEVYGLLQVKKETWKDIKETIQEKVDSIKTEIDRYDWDKVFAERIADIYYMINTKDAEITWEERYERYFVPNKVDKLAENTFNDYFNGVVDMVILDFKTSNKPVILVKTDSQYRLFWLYENKVENHYVNLKEVELKSVIDDKGEHLAFVQERKIYYLENYVNYDSDSVVFGFDDKDYQDKLEKKGIKAINDVEIKYAQVNINDLGGFKQALNNYYNSSKNVDYSNTKTWNEDEVNIEVSDYREAYVEYLRNKISNDVNVALVELKSQENPALVVMESDRTYILTYYDDEIFESNKLPKASLGTIKKSTKSYNEYVLISKEGDYRVYYFVESYAIHKDNSYDGEKQIKVKAKNASKGLKSLKYKEVNTNVNMTLVKKDDFSKLEELLGLNKNS